MTDFPAQRYFDAIDATWAPASFEPSGPFRLRNGAGGGKRVSAATLNSKTATEDDINAASSAMIALSQPPLFMLKPGQEDLDQMLADLGFQIIDPVVLYASPAKKLAPKAPKGLAIIPSNLQLAAQKEIWATDNIGPERLAVMERVKGPKSYLLSRHNDRIAGTVFVSCDAEIAMLHALTVSEYARQQGVGKNLTYGCAKWALDQGATTLALMTTEDNTPARRLYEGIGMAEVSRYHYRIRTE